MNKTTLFSFFLSFFCVLTCQTFAKNSPENIMNEQKYLENRISTSDKRYSSFLKLLRNLKKIEAKILVETGTARGGDQNFGGDGGSTIIFGDWVSQNDAKLYSVDHSISAIESARDATKLYADHIQFVIDDSIKFLENFDQPIDFLYLDSYDFDPNDPRPSQEHHLREIVAAQPFLHNNSIVMIDDCDLPHGGKGKLVIKYLISKDWVILHQGYQTILIHKNNQFIAIK